MKRAIISHSEVDQSLTCERSHLYAVGKQQPEGDNPGLESKTLSDGLFRGNLGHKALAEYYSYLSYRMPPYTYADFDVAAEKMQTVLMKAVSEFPERTEMIVGLIAVLGNYSEHYREEDKQWVFSAIETEFREDIDKDITFPFKIDLIRQRMTDGYTEVVDHKFLANLYTGDEIAIQPQLPKYLGTLRNLGYRVDNATYDLIGHRVLKTRAYDPAVSMRRVQVNPTKQRINRTLREQYRVIRQIALLKELGPELWEDQVNRTANSFNCKNCPFLAICVSDLNGEDNSVAVKYDYAPNSYGYSVGSNDD